MKNVSCQLATRKPKLGYVALVSAVFALVGCGADSPPNDEISARAALVPSAPRTCTTTDDCGDNEICAGDYGCDTAWTCQPAPAVCLLIAAELCTCGGATVWGDRDCIGVQLAHAGSCN